MTRSEAAIKRWADIARREKQSTIAKARLGLASPRSKTWSLETPSKKNILTSACRQFCQEHNLSYSALKRKAFVSDTTPISRGKSKGWSVLACTEKT